MTIADLVESLIASGTPPALAAQVVSEAFALGSIRRHSADIVDEQAERRRAADRERKRIVRRQSADSADNPQISEPALTLKKDIDKKESKRARKHPLPSDWCPSESHFDAAANAGVARAGVEAKAEDLRIWAGSTAALKADWDLTFHGFLRRDYEKLAAQYPIPPPMNGHNGASFYAAFNSKQLEAWEAYERRTGKKTPRDKRGGWNFPTEWPPEHV